MPPKWQGELTRLTTEIRMHVDVLGVQSTEEWDKEFARLLGEIFELGWDAGVEYGS